MVTTDTFKRGFYKGITTFFELSKILVPVYLGVQLLSVSGILSIMADFFTPAMSVFGLPGETSLVLILGYFSGGYAALGAMAVIKLTSIQITTVSIMVTIAHSLITEGAVVKKLGVSTMASVLLRILFSLIAGFLFNLIFG
ncbi:MAG: nucleoside recognition domain-containing protein [Sedimentibacter sp.]|uniref:nucleoside recognition domain-containing protein n=1 Tax=Sedimentibacter sp. TaxID=1960295 RepID=UPI003158F320